MKTGNLNPTDLLTGRDLKVMSSPIIKYFEYAHLPERLQEVSKPIGELARRIDESLPDCAEKSAGLRKLLEAKDCLVRAKLDAAASPLPADPLPPPPKADPFALDTHADLARFAGKKD